MVSNLYESLAGVALAVHLFWILWVVLGCLVTLSRPLLRWVHILSLFYGILIEVLPWPCPLTIAEQWFQSRAGITPYHESFLIHYLQALVYPNVSQKFLMWCGIGVCLFNLGVYGVRFRRRQRNGW
jgi:hypothetical protein